MGDKDEDKSPFSGALAEQLDNLDIEPSETNPADQADEDPRKDQDDRGGAAQSRQPESSGPTPPHPEDASPSEQPELSDEELFARAVEELAPEDVYRGKFAGEGPSSAGQGGRGPVDEPDAAHDQPADERDERDEAGAREEIAQQREIRQFEKAIGPVDRTIDRSKYRKRQPPDPVEHALERGVGDQESATAMATPPLPKSGDGLHDVTPLDDAHKDLISRYKKQRRNTEVYEINVRGETVEHALEQVEFFVHQQHQQRARFARVIHGRGKQSKGEPVLKPAILRWLEGPGLRYVRGYAPEVNSAGDYGSVIIELEESSTDE